MENSIKLVSLSICYFQAKNGVDLGTLREMLDILEEKEGVSIVDEALARQFMWQLYLGTYLYSGCYKYERTEILLFPTLILG